MVLLIGVCGLAVIGIYFTIRMKLDHKTHQIIIDEVQRIHNGGKMEDVDPQVKKVCEALTGFKYEECFGNNKVGYHPDENYFTAKNIGIVILFIAIIVVLFTKMYGLW